jgi:hypothetical protein
MFNIVGKLRCPVCAKPIQLEDKVFLDIINTVIHQKCYYQSPYHRIPKKDEGAFKNKKYC